MPSLIEGERRAESDQERWGWLFQHCAVPCSFNAASSFYVRFDCGCRRHRGRSMVSAKAMPFARTLNQVSSGGDYIPFRGGRIDADPRECRSRRIRWRSIRPTSLDKASRRRR
jgi:hypothetical protein